MPNARFLRSGNGKILWRPDKRRFTLYGSSESTKPSSKVTVSMSTHRHQLHPGSYIRDHVIPDSLSVTKAAKVLGVSRAALSNLLNGKASLSPTMAVRFEKAFGADKAQLLSMQNAYDEALFSRRNSTIIVKGYAPNFLRITADVINAWADKIEARSVLPALLRRLIHTTGTSITEIDFPAYELAQRHGWDGKLVCESPNAWVPSGRSGWEFGCDAKPKEKAESDYVARNNLTSEERRNTTFVFVTPRHWPKKQDWVVERRSEGLWHDVRAYDANDLEQWLENSPPAQLWLAEVVGVPTAGCRTLDRYWEDWAGVAEPPISPKIFHGISRAHAATIQKWFESAEVKPLIISASSREEGKAFLAASVHLCGDIEALGQQAVVFESEETMRRLAGITTDIVPVIATGGLEKIVFDVFRDGKIVVIADSNFKTGEKVVSVGMPDQESIRTAVEDMGLDAAQYASVIRGSGGSPTILRRLLAKTPGVGSPDWAQRAVYRKWMVPFVLLGRWDWTNSSDKELIRLLADNEIDVIDERIAELAALADAPIRTERGVSGVASRLESLDVVAAYITQSAIDRFFFVAELVLNEDDPSLDLERSQQWLAAVWGKVRAHSNVVRSAIAESLVVLAVHGKDVVGGGIGSSVEGRVGRLVATLLKDRDPRAWLAQRNEFRAYAEAAPDIFLDLVEGELRKKESALDCLFEPAESGPFARCERTGLLWALELLAWSPVRLSRVVNILAEMCRYDLQDNWGNKPEASLRDILLSWRPHTLASLEQRIEALEQLCERYPEVGWKFCVSQLSGLNGFTSGTCQPNWRSDASDHRRGVTHHDVFVFQRKCLDLILGWSAYTTSKLKDCIALSVELPESDRQRVQSHIEAWLGTDPSQADVADVREHVRTRFMTRRSRRHTANPSHNGKTRDLYELLKPSDIVERHRWLFVNSWVEETYDEIQTEHFDYEARDQWVTDRRREALTEIYHARGYRGVFDLLACGVQAYVIGRFLRSDVLSPGQLREFVFKAVNGWENVSDVQIDDCISGCLHQMSEDNLRDLLREWRSRQSECNNWDCLVKLFLLAPFNRTTWSLAACMGEVARKKYWKEVKAVAWNFDAESLHEGVEQLLEAGRPMAAFMLSRFELKLLNVQIVTRILEEIPQAGGADNEHIRIEAWDVIKALEVLTASKEVERGKLAYFEFVYGNVIGAWSGYKFQNLSAEVSVSPDTFFRFVALCYCRRDKREDRAALGLPENDEQLRLNVNLARSALEHITQIPGQRDDGSVDETHLVDWVSSVRVMASEHDRIEITDLKIGALLQRCGPGEDGVWPRPEVRRALENFASKDMADGLITSVLNSRGAQCRPSPDNGEPERALAAKYRAFAESVAARTPFVGKTLIDIAESLEIDARRHDSDGRMEQLFPL